MLIHSMGINTVVALYGDRWHFTVVISSQRAQVSKPTKYCTYFNKKQNQRLSVSSSLDPLTHTSVRATRAHVRRQGCLHISARLSCALTVPVGSLVSPGDSQRTIHSNSR